jgi:hypothetical protein
MLCRMKFPNRLIFLFFQGGYNLRIKAIHILNAPPYAGPLIAMLKLVLNSKVAAGVSMLISTYVRVSYTDVAQPSSNSCCSSALVPCSAIGPNFMTSKHINSSSRVILKTGRLLIYEEFHVLRYNSGYSVEISQELEFVITTAVSSTNPMW